MPLKKPSELFGSKVVEEKNSSPARKYLNDTYQQFQGSLFKIEELQERVEEIYTQYPKTFEILANELDNRITKDDLDNTMFTHLTVVDENFNAIKEQVKGVNKKDLREFRNNVSELTDIVENLIDVELPQYKNRVTGTEVKVSDKLTESENKVTEELNKFSSFLEEKIGQFDKEFAETKQDVLKTSETYQRLYQVAENKYLEENKKLEEYSNILEDFNGRVNNFRDEINFKIEEYEKYIFTKRDSITTDIAEFKKEIKSDLSSARADVLVYEKHRENDILEVSKIKENVSSVENDIGKIEGYIQDNKKDLVELKENVIDDLSNILKGDIQVNIRRLENKIRDIQEKYDAIKPEEVMQDLKEGLLNIPPDEKNSDPLTPLDKNFVTTKQLQDHYRLFLNRIQQQLSTLGGGGETQLKYLDDIVGVATNAYAYHNKFLTYDSLIGKFEFKTVTAEAQIAGINTAGISTFSKIHVGIDTGYFSEDLVVNGNGRVTGILTIGTGSITLDPNEEQIKVGNTMLKRNAATGNLDIMDNHGKFKEIRVRGGDAASKNDAIAFAIALG